MEGGEINNRNSNIDMIRIVAMLLVVALHCMDYGGFIKLSEANLFLSLFVSLNHTISIEISPVLGNLIKCTLCQGHYDFSFSDFYFIFICCVEASK